MIHLSMKYKIYDIWNRNEKGYIAFDIFHTSYKNENDLTLGAFIAFLHDNIVLNGQPFRDR